MTTFAEHADIEPAAFLAATVDLDRGESPFGWSDAAATPAADEADR